jgi:hypothetical protein
VVEGDVAVDPRHLVCQVAQVGGQQRELSEHAVNRQGVEPSGGGIDISQETAVSN